MTIKAPRRTIPAHYLPTLTGTPKQVAWAINLRAQHLAWIDEQEWRSSSRAFAILAARTPTASDIDVMGTGFARFEGARRAALAETDAVRWITAVASDHEAVLGLVQEPHYGCIWAESRGLPPIDAPTPQSRAWAEAIRARACTSMDGEIATNAADLVQVRRQPWTPPFMLAMEEHGVEVRDEILSHTDASWWYAHPGHRLQDEVVRRYIHLYDEEHATT